MPKYHIAGYSVAPSVLSRLLIGRQSNTAYTRRLSRPLDDIQYSSPDLFLYDLTSFYNGWLFSRV